VAEVTTTEPDVDHWPTPDESTYRKAARAGIWASTKYDGLSSAEIDESVDTLVADRAFRAMVAAVWADRLPTPWAYHQACRALEKHRLRGEVLAGEVDRLRVELDAVRPAVADLPIDQLPKEIP
jgi:hypothetical protein